MAEKELFLTTLSLLIVWGLLHVAEYILYFNILFLPGNAYLNLLLLGNLLITQSLEWIYWKFLIR